MSRIYNLHGQEFGYLKVVGIAEQRPEHWGQLAWLCRCRCGNTKEVTSRNLRAGRTKSCGCARVELVAEKNIKHGKAANGKLDQVYRVWIEMKQRCYNHKNKRYEQYGGRGIKVCGRWLNSFENFAADMGPRPGSGKQGCRSEYSIDRRENDGDYEPGNCYWATRSQQAGNKSTTPLLSHNGKTMSVRSWSKEIGVSYKTLVRRLAANLSIAEALTPKNEKKRLNIRKE